MRPTSRRARAHREWRAPARLSRTYAGRCASAMRLCCAEPRGQRGRRKRCERRPSFVERGRGAARRSAKQSARIWRNSFRTAKRMYSFNLLCRFIECIQCDAIVTRCIQKRNGCAVGATQGTDPRARASWSPGEQVSSPQSARNYVCSALPEYTVKSLCDHAEDKVEGVALPRGS